MNNHNQFVNKNGTNTISKRIALEKEICRQTEKVLGTLNSDHKALAKELSIQFKASKEVQNYFKVNDNHLNGDFIDNGKSEILDLKEFLYEQMYVVKETIIKLKMEIKNTSSFQNTLQCYENRRRNKLKLIFLKEILSSNELSFLKAFSNFSFSQKPLRKRVFLRIIGCEGISRCFTLKSILDGLPCLIKKEMKDSTLSDNNSNINAKIRCDFLINGQIIFSTVSREPSLQCWNTTFDYVHDFSKALEIHVIYLAPYKQLSGVIKKEASHYKSLDFILAAFGYVFLNYEIECGFINRSIDLYPEGRIFLETFIEPIQRNKKSFKSLLQQSVTTDISTSSRLSKSLSPSLPGFKLCALLGTGHFGKIILCQQSLDRKYYAIKIIKKQRVVESDEYEQIITEKIVLQVIKEQNHPLMVHLFSCIQDSGHIMFVLEFIQGGDLATLIHYLGRFSEEQALFYAASVTLCLEFLHKNNIMYRDLKMENLLLDSKGYIKLVDFGLCKLNMDKNGRTGTFCGTIDYMAPEVLCDGTYTRMVDWWALGVLSYFMLTGEVPFHAETDMESFNSILHKSITIPMNMNAITSSFIISLLNKNPKSRLGSKNGATEVKIHPYFGNIDLHKILRRQLSAPFIPDLKHEIDLSFFDQQFTTQKPTLSLTSFDQTNYPDAKLFFDTFV